MASAEVPTEQFENISIRKYRIEFERNEICLDFHVEGPAVYTSEKNGSDETGDGSEGKPFKTPLQVFN